MLSRIKYYHVLVAYAFMGCTTSNHRYATTARYHDWMKEQIGATEDEMIKMRVIDQVCVGLLWPIQWKRIMNFPNAEGPDRTKWNEQETQTIIKSWSYLRDFVRAEWTLSGLKKWANDDKEEIDKYKKRIEENNKKD